MMQNDLEGMKIPKELAVQLKEGLYQEQVENGNVALLDAFMEKIKEATFFDLFYTRLIKEKDTEYCSMVNDYYDYCIDMINLHNEVDRIEPTIKEIESLVNKLQKCIRELKELK